MAKYTLKAEIPMMSPNEAEAMTRALVQKFGTQFVEDIIKEEKTKPTEVLSRTSIEIRPGAAVTVPPPLR